MIENLDPNNKSEGTSCLNRSVCFGERQMMRRLYISAVEKMSWLKLDEVSKFTITTKEKQHLTFTTLFTRVVNFCFGASTLASIEFWGV